MMPNTYDRDRLVQAHRRGFAGGGGDRKVAAGAVAPAERRVLRLPRQFKMFWGAFLGPLATGIPAANGLREVLRYAQDDMANRMTCPGGRLEEGEY